MAEAEQLNFRGFGDKVSELRNFSESAVYLRLGGNCLVTVMNHLTWGNLVNAKEP
jgi:hypothetical protein